jgi:hypothetical protein
MAAAFMLADGGVVRASAFGMATVEAVEFRERLRQ